MRKYLLLFSFMLFAALKVNAQDSVNVTFQVDMTVQAAKGAFQSTDHVSARGDFNGWGETNMSDEDGDSIYAVTVKIAKNTTIAYKYFHSGNGGTWEDGDNKSLAVETSDIVLDANPFNGEEMPSGAPQSVTFNVDMEKYESTGAFDKTQNNVFIAGSFTDWQNGALLMADNGADTSVYTITVDNINSAQLLKFKFMWAPGDTVGAPGTTWESISDRSYWVVDGENNFSAFWNDEDPHAADLADGNITFKVDMSVMNEVGIFDPDHDSVQVRGGFNGWSGSDVAKSHMNQDFLDANKWFLKVPFSQIPIGSEQAYKFFVDIDSAANANKFSMWTDGWERPFSQGGGNRPVAFAGTDDQEVAEVYYDGVLPNYVIENDGIEITFSVNMADAADASKMVPTFDPAADTVWWISEEPAFTYSQGWTDGDDMKVLALTDDNSDMIYEGTLTVKAPAWNGFEYRYGFTHGGTMTQEEAGFGAFAYRVRYIEQNGYRSFVQPYSAPTDSWALQENKQDQWEAEPAGDYTTGITETGIIANKFELGQNYPNPFNPTTKINFSIPQSNYVTLKVFNLLGEEVSTLISGDMKAGSYVFDFNASKLASGLYFYTLTSGDFVSTKKMMLLK